MKSQTDAHTVEAIAMDASVPGNAFKTRYSLAMMACCTAMVAGVAILVWSAPAGQSIGQTMLLAAPMLGCVAMHLVLHRFLGKSCHSHSKQEPQND